MTPGRGRNFPEVRVKSGVPAVHLAGGGAGIRSGICLTVGSKLLLFSTNLESEHQPSTDTGGYSTGCIDCKAVQSLEALSGSWLIRCFSSEIQTGDSWIPIQPVLKEGCVEALQPLWG